ncbi:MAG: hypothetical protein JW833_07465 [Prolixibacteraceae bacterium]|nr:hypothetical protein [Prolixibacteraceae bacterium]
MSVANRRRTRRDNLKTKPPLPAYPYALRWHLPLRGGENKEYFVFFAPEGTAVVQLSLQTTDYLTPRRRPGENYPENKAIIRIM